MKKLLLGVYLVGVLGCMMGGVKSDKQRQQDAAVEVDKVHPVPPALKTPKSVPEAQALIQPAFDAAVRATQPPPVLIKAYPLDDDWSMERNEATGRITGRSINVAAFYKGGKTGFCRYEKSTINQEEQGGHWGKPYTVSIDFNGNRRTLGSMGFRYDCAENDSLPNP